MHSVLFFPFTSFPLAFLSTPFSATLGSFSSTRLFSAVAGAWLTRAPALRLRCQHAPVCLGCACFFLSAAPPVKGKREKRSPWRCVWLPLLPLLLPPHRRCALRRASKRLTPKRSASCVCVCVCLSLPLSFSLSPRASMCVYVCTCVCNFLVCVSFSLCSYASSHCFPTFPPSFHPSSHFPFFPRTFMTPRTCARRPRSAATASSPKTTPVSEPQGEKRKTTAYLGSRPASSTLGPLQRLATARMPGLGHSVHAAPCSSSPPPPRRCRHLPPDRLSRPRDPPDHRHHLQPQLTTPIASAAALRGGVSLTRRGLVATYQSIYVSLAPLSASALPASGSGLTAPHRPCRVWPFPTAHRRTRAACALASSASAELQRVRPCPLCLGRLTLLVLRLPGLILPVLSSMLLARQLSASRCPRTSGTPTAWLLRALPPSLSTASAPP